MGRPTGNADNLSATVTALPQVVFPGEEIAWIRASSAKAPSHPAQCHVLDVAPERHHRGG